MKILAFSFVLIFLTLTNLSAQDLAFTYNAKDLTNKIDSKKATNIVTGEIASADEILICPHKWGEYEHPTMINPNISPGNGLILYFRTEHINVIRQNVTKLGGHIEEEIHVNRNSNKKEFSIRDPDGYNLTITEFHQYEG